MDVVLFVILLARDAMALAIKNAKNAIAINTCLISNACLAVD